MKLTPINKKVGQFALMVVAAALVACGGSSEPSPTPTSAVPATAQGAALATVKGDTAGVGTTFFNANGKGFVVLSADGDAPASVVHVVDNTRGRRAPAASGFITLSYDRTAPQTLVAITATSVAGTYAAMVSGKTASFTVAADGTIAPGSTDCKLGGKIALANAYGGAQAVSLTTSNCGTVANATFSGLVYASADTAPASWQLVAENGTSVIDILAYR